MKWFLLVTALIIVAGGAFLLFRNGAFLPVEISRESRGPYLLLQKEHLGPYNEIIGDLREVEAWAQEHKVPCEQTFGEYLDDPNMIDAGRLRAEVGCVVTGVTASQMPALPPAYKLREWPAQSAVVARYAGSPALGPYKVYGKAESYIAAQKLRANGAVVEIYDIRGDAMSTTYLFPAN